MVLDEANERIYITGFTEGSLQNHERNGVVDLFIIKINMTNGIRVSSI